MKIHMTVHMSINMNIHISVYIMTCMPMYMSMHTLIHSTPIHIYLYARCEGSQSTTVTSALVIAAALLVAFLVFGTLLFVWCPAPAPYPALGSPSTVPQCCAPKLVTPHLLPVKN